MRAHPPLILRQNLSTPETRAISQAAMLTDVPLKVIGIESLIANETALIGGAMPVGSVEFVREAMRVAGIREPDNLSYPRVLRHELRREVKLMRAGSVIGQWFVKPERTKMFTGFVFDTMQDPATLDAHDREQYEAFMAMAPNDRVWVSEPVSFAAEWRHYVLDGVPIASARYDSDGLDDVAPPNPLWLARLISKFSAAQGVAAYAIDVGRFESGELALVEVNDGWAVGLYGQSMQPRVYLDFLSARWVQLIATRGLRSGSTRTLNDTGCS